MDAKKLNNFVSSHHFQQIFKEIEMIKEFAFRYLKIGHNQFDMPDLELESKILSRYLPRYILHTY